MKKTIFTVCSLAALLFLQLNAVAQDNDEKRIEGNGHIITKDFSVQAFDKIDGSGVFNIILSQGNKEAVKIETDENLMDLFEVTNEGSTLKISMKKHSNFHSSKKMKVYVSFQKLKGMVLKMVGGVSSEENLNFDDLSIDSKGVGSVDLKLTAQTLHVINAGVGSIHLTGKANNANIRNSGVGSIEAGEFVVQTMDINNSGVGHSEVNAEKELTIKDSFLGKVHNKGNATVKRLNKTSI